MSGSYLQIAQCIKRLQNKYNLSICVKDFDGSLLKRPELDEALHPYLIHANPFCSYIKQDGQAYIGCLSMTPKIRKKCAEKGSFFGICHAGMGECIAPIVRNGVVTATVNAGFFPVDHGLGSRRIESVCKASQLLDAGIAADIKSRYISPPLISPEQVLPMLEVLADYLLFAYGASGGVDEAMDSNVSGVHTGGRDTILVCALSYIGERFTSPLTVKEIAGHCGCSASYLSHVFNRGTGSNINSYLNNMRVELSKRYLTNTTESISSIAKRVGFRDANYFSRVFLRHTRQTPSEFREITRNVLYDYTS